jgi:hypothetical protein
MYFFFHLTMQKTVIDSLNSKNKIAEHAYILATVKF